MEDVVAMQQAARERVRRMQERSRRLCMPTYGAQVQEEKPQPPAHKAKNLDERWLLMLLLLMLSQNGGGKTLLILLAYLII